MHQRLLLLKNSKVILKTLSLILLGISVLSITCREQKDITQDIVVPDWQNGEKLYYRIMRNDTMIGSVTYSLYFDTDGDIPIFSLEMLSQTESDEDYVWDSSIVHFRRDNFAPIWALRNIETDFGYSTVETHYDGSDVEIWLETIDGKESYDLSIREPYFDNEMLFTILRAVRFSKFKKYTMNILLPLSLQNMSMSVRHSGITTVTTPAGSFECDRVSLTSMQDKINLFYERGEPRRLIRYQRNKSPIAVVLLK
jgi:hypothetical protein